jgi:hypothetical protein
MDKYLSEHPIEKDEDTWKTSLSLFLIMACLSNDVKEISIVNHL